MLKELSPGKDNYILVVVLGIPLSSAGHVFHIISILENQNIPNEREDIHRSVIFLAPSLLLFHCRLHSSIAMHFHGN